MQANGNASLIRNECKEDEMLQKYVKEMGTLLPLEPRDAFYGGRTEAFTLYKEATDDEKIKYYDVTSLYLFINKIGKVPLGHPAIITENLVQQKIMTD